MPSIARIIATLIALRILLVLFAISLPGCASVVATDFDKFDAQSASPMDADVADADLPQCSPLGSPSGRYCNTTDDGKCMTTICDCTDSLGNKIPTTVYPMVGFDAGDCSVPVGPQP
jgi:hypothetical protein